MMKQYQATFHKYGKLYKEHVNVPVEAESRKAARERAIQENPMLASWKVTIAPLEEGEQAQDDRATLALRGTPRMGRPSQGRDKRIQAHVTPELAAWLETQKQAGESVSDAIFRLLNELKNQQ